MIFGNSCHSSDADALLTRTVLSAPGTQGAWSATHDSADRPCGGDFVEESGKGVRSPSFDRASHASNRGVDRAYLTRKRVAILARWECVPGYRGLLGLFSSLSASRSTRRRSRRASSWREPA